MNGNDSTHTRCVSPVKNATFRSPKHFQIFFLPRISSVPPTLAQPRLSKKELQGRQSLQVGF